LVNVISMEGMENGDFGSGRTEHFGMYKSATTNQVTACIPRRANVISIVYLGPAVRPRDRVSF
jgi:hypothetical protein